MILLFRSHFLSAFFYIFLAGYSVLAIPFFMLPILYFWEKSDSNPERAAVASRWANNLATHSLT